MERGRQNKSALLHPKGGAFKLKPQKFVEDKSRTFDIGSLSEAIPKAGTVILTTCEIQVNHICKLLFLLLYSTGVKDEI